MDKLIRGVIRFQEEVYPRLESRFTELAEQQHPRALFITCSDSRIVPDLLTQTSPGELFICRNAGNIVPAHGEATGGVSGTIEYAVAALKVRHIIICGHSDCGAMKGILHPEDVASMPAVAAWLRYGEAARRIVLDNQPHLDENQKLEAITRENVRAQLLNLQTHPSVAAALAAGAVQLHGWLYSIRSGVIETFDQRMNRFRSLTLADASVAAGGSRSEVA
jgi:carbonic anhydrase